MREAPYQANRPLGVLSRIFNLTEFWGLRPDGSNPCRHVKRFLSDEEYRRLGEALKEVERDGSGTPAAVAASRRISLGPSTASHANKPAGA